MKNSRKIAIVGADTGKSNAPFGEKGWEVWSLNNLYTGFHSGRKFDRWYELHSFAKKVPTLDANPKWSDDYGEYIRRGVDVYGSKTVEAYMKEIALLDTPVFMQKRWDIIPKSQVFPFDEIMKKFDTRYFGCSFTWMTAHALLEHLQGKKVDTIAYYGVNLSGVEYYQQRPTLEHMIGRAMGMGIKVVIPEDSQLLKMNFVYAYDENFETIDMLFADGGKKIAMIIETAVQQLMDTMQNGN